MLDALKTFFNHRDHRASEKDATHPPVAIEPASHHHEDRVADGDGTPAAQPRGKPLTWPEIKKAYQRGPSFTRFLPWVEYLPDSGCFLLEDGVSVGIAAEVTPIPTEGRSQDTLAGLRDQIEATLQDALPEYDSYPWVVQLYCRDEVDPAAEMARVVQHADPALLDTAFTQAWLRSMEQHLQAIAKPGGLFQDDVVTRTDWRGQTRRVRLVLYRWLGPNPKGVPEEAANQVYDRLAAGLEGTGLQLKKMNGAAFHRWMLTWFNPRPATDPDTPHAFYDRVAYPGDDAVAGLPDYDFAEDLLYRSPRADVDSGLWYFDGLPHRAIPVEAMRRAPDVGHLTGEMPRAGGQAFNALMDVLPEDTEMVLTIVATPQDVLEDHINTLHGKAHGDSVHATAVREDCQTARAMLNQNHKLYRSSLVFYVRGHNETDLEQRTLTLITQLQSAHLKPVDAEDEIAPLNTWLRWLPMAFDPQQDKPGWYTRLNYVQHLANLAPLFGRSRGTGRPGFSFFNRGGGSFGFDPLDPNDRAKNGHMFVFGPTGAGKSATLNGIFSQVMALRRPRLFVIEVGNSFGLLGEYFQRHGLTVNRVKMAPGKAPPLPLFSEAHRLLDDDAITERRKVEDRQDGWSDEPAPVPEDNDEEDDEDADERDVLGEMELTARLMITGGDPQEEAEFRRADRRLVRDAIFYGAQRSRDEGRQCLTQDVVAGLHALATDPKVPLPRQSRAHEMAEAMALFCDGFDGEVFNREGQAWPECDVTIVDLAHYARDGYEAHLALAVISLTNIIITLAERDQYKGRPIIQAIDECHIVTINPLLSPYLVKAGKMGRKLFYWIWLATQNLEDFPDASQKLLNMIEWWLCLVTPPDEIEQIARFKALSAEQKTLIGSAAKARGRYTEGVVLADRIEALFRIVPPSLYLSLAGTEGEEKQERKRVMDEHQCSELDAAIRIAEEMDRKRGLHALDDKAAPGRRPGGHGP
ncbi:conjugative transfer ATPase [Alloalcanivorax xenomutans]|nr:conjugative transfer ATPase [Alloalcanivorax xenomutans]WOD27662.1 conjugative transfer ATPase [Alloalcanivorax xenomutans]